MHRAAQSVALPRPLLVATLWCLDRVATVLIAARVSANTVTASSLVVAAVGGVLLGFGQFGWAALAMIAASLGDALDGIVARRTGSSSVAGALLDASVDRYQELLLLGGMAVYLRTSTWALVATLGALGGSFMVSYGSAKAEGLRVAAPPGVMRRAERATVLCAGVVLTPAFDRAVRSGFLPAWAEHAPLLLAIGAVAVVANISAVRRLRAVALRRMRVARPSLRTRSCISSGCSSSV
jgi:CDP-diacylglycerol--glycerol-3-phosphate 3-phosphatidyltransferase